MKKTITKEFNFCYAHLLENKELSKEENIRVFGKCFLSSHGHNAKMLIKISGKEKNGMIMNFTELKKIVNKNIVNLFDHRNLNEITYFKNTIPTCENIIDVFWELLEEDLEKEDVQLEKIKLYETETSFCELER